MKKSTRLTALLLALLLLLASLSASATENENVLTMDGLVLNDYFGLVSDAESVGLRISEECGSLNPYCASANKLIGMTSAQARYDYLAAMTSVDAANVLLHYDLKHADANALCLCAYPYFDAAYVPGGSNHEADCPWHADNLPVQEEESKGECSSKDLCVYVDDGSIERAFFSQDAFHVYDTIYKMYNDAKDETAKEVVLTFAGHLYDVHTDIFCQCNDNPIEAHPTYDIGLNVHGDNCPWRFEALTTAEQAYVLSKITAATEKDTYKAKLTEAQKAALDDFMAGISANDVTLGTADNSVSLYFQIANGVFNGTHVLQAGEAPLVVEMENALKAKAVGHTLAAFDVQFLNLNRPGEELQPADGQSVQMTFTVDLNKVEGNSFRVYHLEKNGSGYTATPVSDKVSFSAEETVKSVTINANAFSVYAVRFECSGDGCGYNAFKSMTGFAREAYLEDLLVNSGETAYDNFVGHINGYHYTDDPAYCTCSSYKTDYNALGYGTIAHGKDSFTGEYCLWHFSQIPVDDEYTIYTVLSDADKEAYLATITDAAKRAQLLAKINPPMVDTPKWDTSSETIELTFVQEGASEYQWYQSTDNGATWVAIDGATGSKLVLDVSKNNDALGYAYKCEAKFSNGAVVPSVSMGLIDYDMREWVRSSGIEVTKDMLKRALEVDAKIKELDLNFTALQAMRIESTQLMSVKTGQPIANYDPQTGALVDISMGLTVGYLRNGAIEAPANDVTGGETAGDDTANN